MEDSAVALRVNLGGEGCLCYAQTLTGESPLKILITSEAESAASLNNSGRLCPRLK